MARQGSLAVEHAAQREGQPFGIDVLQQVADRAGSERVEEIDVAS